MSRLILSDRDRLLMIAAECLFKPGVELAKEKTEICGRRFLEKLDDTRAEILLRVIDRPRQMHGCPEIAAPLLIEDFYGVWQPIEVLASEAEFHFTS